MKNWAGRIDGGDKDKSKGESVERNKERVSRGATVRQIERVHYKVCV